MTAARTVRPPAALLALLLAGPAAWADPARPAWDPARTTSPDSVDELKALEARVKQVVDKATPSTVGLRVPAGGMMGAGSGVIVRDDGLVLTAAHVIGKPGRPVQVVLTVPGAGGKPDFLEVKGRALGVNQKIDSGMVKITDKPPADAPWPGAKDGKWPAAALGKSAGLKKGQWVVALGHHGGPKVGRRPPVRVGRFENYSERDTALRSDCALVGGDSGGPLFDLTGKVVGIHSRIGLFLEHNLHVPTEAFQDEWDKLAGGDVVTPAGGADLGLALDDEDDAPTVKTVAPGGPAAKAGVQPGDVVAKVNGLPVHISDDLAQALTGVEPGEVVVVEVVRGTKTLKLRVTAGKTPAPKERKDKKGK